MIAFLDQVSCYNDLFRSPVGNFVRAPALLGMGSDGIAILRNRLSARRDVKFCHSCTPTSVGPLWSISASIVAISRGCFSRSSPAVFLDSVRHSTCQFSRSSTEHQKEPRCRPKRTRAI